jgi:uncharacterized membrane protein YraQ (UPF0718 family)
MEPCEDICCSRTAWLVSHIGSLAAFLIFGIGTELLAVIILLVLFKRRGWMGRGS